MDYNFREIEKKWQDQWEQDQTYKVENEFSKPKYYCLSMFPYPSGSGLHVGHPLGYIATDIFARYKRLKGFNVLHPMGFDAFGLPAEQYAIETGQHPEVTTKNNIAAFKKQFRNIGFSYDWSREVQTCDPNYYKWTQWGFLKLFNAWYDRDADKAKSIDELMAAFDEGGTSAVNAATDSSRTFSADEWKSFDEKERSSVLMDYRLAYQSMAWVNWCEELGTVLANDEVKDGVSERGGFPVVKKPMTQWFLRITAYAERLLQGLEDLDWSNAMKEMQRNWIGRSEGAEVQFQIDETEESMLVYTTRPDTIFGATFMVLAPEHDLVSKIVSDAQRAEVDEYLAHVESRSDIERQAEKKVTGAFTGAYALNPFNGAKIPIWVAEYVLIGYGTGAIMAVPCDDERDRTFAEKYDLPIVDIIDKSEFPDADIEDKVGTMINSDLLNGLPVLEAIEKIKEEIEGRGIGNRQVNYKMRDAGFSRQRYWGEPFPIVHENGSREWNR